MELLKQQGLAFGFRWLHVLGGITWIGLLYYFNLVQVPAFAAYGDEGRARNIAIDKVARRALWWFRWAAAFTLGTGLLIVGVTQNAIGDNYMKNFMSSDSNFGPGHDAAIFVGMVFGVTMAANVWMVIWKNQKVILANAVNLLNGGVADPAAAGAGRSALLSSRQNTIFSVAMLFFMVGASHFYSGAFADASRGQAWTFSLVAIAIGAVLQVLSLGLIGGKATTNKLLWPYENHKNAIISAFSLWAVLWILSEIILG
ncbi:MAG: urate hydroxylase PuuD [Ilumatobacteraceae bacterium]